MKNPTNKLQDIFRKGLQCNAFRSGRLLLAGIAIFLISVTTVFSQDVTIGSGTTMTNPSGTTININGNLTINSGGTLANAGTIIITGNWTNNGTYSGAGAVQFTGALSSTISGSSASLINTMTINKGSSTATVLDVNGAGAVSCTTLTFTNGLLRINTGGSFTRIPNVNTTVTSTSGVHVNGGTFSTTASVITQGTFTVSSGTANIGTGSGNRLEVSGGGTLTVTGGAVNVAARIEVSGATSNLNISGGVITLATVGSAAATASLDLSNTSNLNMSNGTVVFQSANTGGNDVNIVAGGTKTISGGTLQFGNTLTAAGSTFKISSAISVFNTTINTTNSPQLSLVANLTINGTLTMNGGNISPVLAQTLLVNNTAPTAIVRTSGFVNGQLKWQLPASVIAPGVYLFPVGKGSTYLPFTITNPVGNSPLITVEAFNVGSGGSPDNLTVFAISNTEYWLASNTGTFSGGSISLTRPTPVGLNDRIARSATLQAGPYSSINGTPSGNSINNGTTTGLGYFVMAQGCAPAAFSPCPSNMTVGTTLNLCTAVVNYTATATGSPAPTVSYTFSGATTGSGSGTGSGSTFNKGVTTVTITAVNACGTATCTFTVTVNDTQAPNAICQNIPVNLNAAGNASITASQINNGSTDNCGIASMTVFPNTFNCSNVGGSGAATAWINEFHYDNTGTDAGEFVEIVGTQGLNLTGWSVVLYNGAGGASYATNALSGIIPNQSNGFGFVVVNYPSNGIQNGNPDGIALINNLGNVVQFLSYGGAMTATNGPAIGQTSVDIGVTEPSTTPVGNSLQLTGTGSSYASFTWANAAVATPNAANNGQTFVQPTGNAVTLTVTDVNGLSSTCTAIVSVFDVTPPVATCQNITVPLNANGTVTVTASQVNNGSSDACGIASMSLSQTSFTCANVGPNPVTLTVTDVNGLTATCSATITITDVTPPVANCQNVTIALDGTGNASITASQINNGSTDACGLNPNMTVTPNTFNCSDITGDPVNDLIISEYIEGTLSNKYIELYNGTAGPINLGNYRLRLYPNGALAPLNNILLSGTLAAGQTIVYQNSGATIYGGTATSNAAVNFSGNDAVELFKVSTGTSVDIFGRIGEDPGSAWTSGANTTVDVTLRRKSTVTQGVTVNPASGFPTLSTEWDQVALNDVSGLGAHLLNGGNLVTLTVTDVNGNSSTCTAYVTVQDVTAPTLNCPVVGNTNRNTDPGVCTYTGVGTEFDATASDNCSFTLTYQLLGATIGTGTTLAGKVFNKGITLVRWTASDGVNTPVLCSFTVTVIDNQQPVITCPVAINADRNTNPGQCTYTVAGTEFNATSTDNCAVTSLTYALSGVTSGTGTTLAGVILNKGVTTVTWTTSDGVNAPVTCSFTVTVIDNQQPVITCPVAVNADRNTNPGQCTYTVAGTEFNATSTDNCAVTSLTYTLSGVTSGTGTTLAGVVLNKGVTTVTWTTSDGVNAPVTCSFTVTVIDNQQPVITCPVAVNADRNTNTGQCTYTVSGTEFNATSTDNCAVTSLTYTLSGVTSGTGTTLAGVVLNKGVTTVTWTTSDGVNPAVTCSFTVTVIDNQQPVITCPVAVNANRNTNAGQCTYAVSGTEFNATSTDNCAVTSLTYTLSGVTSGTGTTLTGVVLNKGVTTVTWSASDGVNTAVTCSFTVTVIDNQQPVITCPVAINANRNTNPGQCTYTVVGTEFNATSTDNCAVTSLTYTLGGVTSGSGTTLAGVVFNKGVTSITWTATDGINPAVTCSFTVTVLDAEFPVFTLACPTSFAACNAPGISWTPPTASDNCSVVLTSNMSPGDVFPPGTTTVTYSAQDPAGNITTCSFAVTVKEVSQNPTSASAAPAVLCSGGQTTLSVNGGFLGTGANWKWYSGSCGGTLVGIGASIQVNPVANTIYFVRAEGDCNTTNCASLSVTVQTASTDPTSATSNAPVNGICIGGSVILSVSGGSLGTGATWKWYEDGCGNGLSIGTGASITITPTFEGLHSYYVRAEGPCNTTNCAAVSVLVGTYSVEATSITSTVAGNSICTGNNITLTLNGGFLGTVAQWKWYSGSCGGTLVATGVTSVTVNPSVTTTYYARAEGSCNTTSCVSITVFVSSSAPSQHANIIQSPQSICSGNQGTFTCQTVSNATFYSWSAPNGTTFNGNNPSPYVTTVPTVNVTFGVLPNGVNGYDICVFAGNGCGTSATKCKHVNGRTISPQIITGNASSCPNTSSLYSCTSSPGADTYLWTITGNATFTNGNDSIVTTGPSTTVNFGPGWTSGLLSVFAQMSCGYQSPAKTITIISTPVVPGVMSGPAIVCPNTSYAFSIATVAGAVSYNWSTNVPGAIVSPAGTSCSVAFPAVIPAGSTVSVTATGSCGTSAPRVKNIATGMANTPGTISGPAMGQCGQTGVGYSILPVAGATSYLWTTNNGALISGLNNITSVSINFPAVFTTCNVNVIAINSCGNSPLQTKLVTGAPGSPGIISGSGAVCLNSVETYSVVGSTGATQYVWTSPVGSQILSGQNFASIQVLYPLNSGGNISVTATNACGSSAASNLAVSIVCRLAQISQGSLIDATLYPNPTFGTTTLKFETITAGDYKVSVVDMTGQVMQTKKVTAVEGVNLHELDLSTYAKGLYMVRLEREGEAMQMLRVTVE